MRLGLTSTAVLVFDSTNGVGTPDGVGRAWRLLDRDREIQKHRLPVGWRGHTDDLEQAERRVGIALRDGDPAEHGAVGRPLEADHSQMDAAKDAAEAEAGWEYRLDSHPDLPFEVQLDEPEDVHLQRNVDRVASARDFRVMLGSGATDAPAPILM